MHGCAGGQVDGQVKRCRHGLTINQWTGWWMDGLLNKQAGEQIDGWTDGFSQMNLIGCTQSHQTLITQKQA